MKTLDEVLDDLELLRVTTQSESEYKLVISVLHYMKEYKRVQNKIEKIALGNIEDTLDKIDNPALTWDELRQMEDKPVWIEFLNDEGEWNGEWCLVESSNNILCEILRCKMSWWGLRKITLGKTWQAYRKERE